MDTLVIHATATDTLAQALDALKIRGLSYHAVIDRCGAVARLAPWDQMALHAGESFGPQGAQVNEYSIGLSLVNRNDGVDRYTPAQEAAIRILVAEIASAHPLRHLVTHRAIAPHRKNDPLGYDAARLARDTGLVLWGED